MYFKATITKWEGLGKPSRIKDTVNGTAYLLNGNRAEGLQTRATTKSLFSYIENPSNPKEVASYIECEESVSDIQTSVDLVFDSLFIKLPVYTDNDPTKDTYDIYINSDTIIFGESYNPSPTDTTWITYQEGQTRKTILVDYSIDDIISLNSHWTPQRILDTFGSRMVLWTSKDDEKAGYYVNKIGIQEREAVTEGAVAGILHPGRAISYDGSKSQYSRTIGNAPLNFKIGTNSLTIFFRIKVVGGKPAANSMVFGNFSGGNSSLYGYIQTDGTFRIIVWDLVSSNVVTSDVVDETNNVCDGLWHDIFVLINKAGNFGLYVDNRLQGTFIDISAKTFGVVAAQPFLIGGQASYFSGIKVIRDFRLWTSAITSDKDRDTIHDGGYVAGCESWWFMEEGKESINNLTKDCVGSNHLSNIGFDGTSLVSGAWPSLLNKFGYSQLTFTGTDIILGDGEFDNAAEWFIWWPLRFNITGGQAVYNATTGNGYIKNLRITNYNTSDILRISFDIIEGPGTIYFSNQDLTAISASAIYAVGNHIVYFKPLTTGTNIVICTIQAGGAFIMDNMIVEQNIFSDSGIVVPKMDAIIPTNDVLGRALTFKDQAKYNLIKVSESVVKLPDYVGELIEVCETVLVNDWYDIDGIGQEIALTNIEALQTNKQYYNNEELILIKD